MVFIIIIVSIILRIIFLKKTYKNNYIHNLNYDFFNSPFIGVFLYGLNVNIDYYYFILYGELFADFVFIGGNLNYYYFYFIYLIL